MDQGRTGGGVRGYRSDPDNLFRWYKIRLDLPGDPSYSPTIPGISTVQGGTQNLAADFTTYLNDSIVAAGSEKRGTEGIPKSGVNLEILGITR